MDTYKSADGLVRFSHRIVERLPCLMGLTFTRYMTHIRVAMRNIVGQPKTSKEVCWISKVYKVENIIEAGVQYGRGAHHGFGKEGG
jgi:hypothetical protein